VLDCLTKVFGSLFFPILGAFVESEVEYFSEEDQRGPRGPLTDGVEVRQSQQQRHGN